MDFEPKIIPEGINTGREHPLREFFVLVGGISLVVVLAVGILAASADYLVGFIPVEKEIEWFAAEAEQLAQAKNDKAAATTTRRQRTVWMLIGVSSLSARPASAR